MLDHVSITAPDLGAAARFYDAVMAALGVPAAGRDDCWIGYGERADATHPERCFVSVYAGPAPEPESRRHWCFKARDRAAVDAFWRAGLEAGGTDDGAPGLRPDYHPHYYGAFLRPRRQPGGSRVQRGAAAVSAEFALRDAEPRDLPTVARLVRDLARYEKLEHLARGTEEAFGRALFGAPPRAFALIAETPGGEAAGFALWFYSFRTFSALPCLYVEDVYVEPEHRRSGLGRLIFADLARRALAEGCDRMEWSVLDWNAPAIAFYDRIGSRPREGWTLRVLTRPALDALAA